MRPRELSTIPTLLLALSFSSACSQAQEPTLHFLKDQDKEALAWAAQWETDQNGLALQPGAYEIHPLDRNTALFFGALKTPAASIRSLLLRTDDGGQTWREVMAPVRGSEVAKVFFHDMNVGWALVGWTTEGPDILTLHGTRDGGKSWRKVSEIPKQHYMGWPVSMSFTDIGNGVLKMLYDGSSPADGLGTLNTTDGGRTWRETSHITLDDYKKTKQAAPQSEEKVVSGQDGSQWKTVGSDLNVRIFRRPGADAPWTLVSAIPAHFGYSKGEVLVQAPEQARSRGGKSP